MYLPKTMPTTKEKLNIVSKEDVIKMFEQLLPWEQKEVADELAGRVPGYDDLKDVINEFSATEVLDCLDMDDVMDYIYDNAPADEIERKFGEFITDDYE